MKFANFLFESKNLDTIKEDCKEFLDGWPKDFPLYRGSSKLGGKFKVRKDRNPLDSSQEVHNYLDALYKKNSGYKLRSEALFCTIDEFDARMFGTVGIVIPKGKFKIFTNHNIKDVSVYFNPNYLKERIWNFFDYPSILKKHKFPKKITNIKFLDYNSGILEYICPKWIIHGNVKEKFMSHINIALDSSIIFKELKSFKELKDMKEVDLPRISKFYDKVIEPFVKDIKKAIDKKVGNLSKIDASNIHEVNRSELMLICDEYYAITKDEWNELFK